MSHQHPVDENTQLNLVLKVLNINLILEALSELPYKKSEGLIKEIMRQAEVQMHPQEEEAEEETEEEEAEEKE